MAMTTRTASVALRRSLMPATRCFGVGPQSHRNLAVVFRQAR
eukprot:CAMPEP_0204325042 /NCGR_PEP_ID=MMETSP0469-20131031/10722_1 /ASSEMBLY_ACC=CAM_ASM_000384 /TAXON_ID=2969 /ORGANISM="Oxyrrhis marina" /LENGTH=41 /DNA_ID= /DNA_START= /DNA_END= /DNA_ORIENTATION=